MFTFTDLQTAGTIIACKGRTCKVTGEALYNADFIQWAKSVLSFFSRRAWSYLRTIGGNLKKAWAQILQEAKELHEMQLPKIRKAVAIAYANYLRFQQQQKRITVALEGQTGFQLANGRKPKGSFADMPTMRAHSSKNTWKTAGKA